MATTWLGWRALIVLKDALRQSVIGGSLKSFPSHRENRKEETIRSNERWWLWLVTEFSCRVFLQQDRQSLRFSLREQRRAYAALWIREASRKGRRTRP